MPLASLIYSVRDRSWTANQQYNGYFAEFGNPAVNRVGTWVFQFTPDTQWQGSFGVLGRAYRHPATPYLQFPYRRVNLNGVASDLTIVSDLISSTGLIYVPAYGIDIALEVGCLAGTCIVDSWALEGPSVP